MKLTITLLFVLVGVLAFASSHNIWRSENNHLYTFEDYEIEFGKNYKDEQEHLIRKEIFNQNLEKIRSHNGNPNSSWKAGVNEFTDRLESELTHLYGKHRPLSFLTKTFVSPKFNHKTDFLKKLPDRVDWREKGVVSPVRNQGACGSCWAFSTIAVSEAHIAIATGKLLSLSEQHIVDCVPNPQHCGGSGGCQGLVEPIAYDYLSKGHGYRARADYQYQARDGACKESQYNEVAKITGFVELKENDPEELLRAVALKGPISISVAASSWRLYESGIFDGDCDLVTNHAVVLVGYGEENGRAYWIVRNSWGDKWGEQGYIRLPRETNAKDVKCGWDLHPEDGSGCDGGPDKVWVCGQCGMYSGSSYPVGASLN